jgi:hypothetical protein
MSEPALTATPADAFMGHWFGDWNHGIDHCKCGHCGLYHHAYSREPIPCRMAPLLERPKSGVLEQVEEGFGTIWAIRPELSPSDTYNHSDCPDVRQFESREQLLEWLDGPRGAGITNRQHRWYGRIAVRNLQDFEGNVSRHSSFNDFIASGPPLVAWPSPKLDFDRIIRLACADEDPPVSCKLGPDWDFEEIVRDCCFRPGYKFDGCEISSFVSFRQSCVGLSRWVNRRRQMGPGLFLREIGE